MATPKLHAMATQFDPPRDLLTYVQLQVARRADELQRAANDSALQLHCWLLAEQEVLGHVALGDPPGGGPASARLSG